MRGRKRHRKKDAKRRGVWGLWVAVRHKSGQRNDVADSIAKWLDWKLRQPKTQARLRAELARGFLWNSGQ